MKYKYFYCDYGEGHQIPSERAVPAEKAELLQSMRRVLYREDNFFGIVNDQDQCLQFMVKEDGLVSIDIPVMENGFYIGSKKKLAALDDCFALVQEMEDLVDFDDLLPEESFEANERIQPEPQRPWWKLW